MSKGAWAGADGNAVVFCLECDWKSDRFNAEHDCPRKPENLEKVIARYRALLKRIGWASVDEDGYSRCPECLGLDPSDSGIAHWPLGAAPVGSSWKGHRPDCELAALLS